MKTRTKTTPEELLSELEAYIVVGVVAVAKEIASMTNQIEGSMTCPRCKTGTLRYSIAPSNGHIRAVCDRVVEVSAQGVIRCINVME